MAAEHLTALRAKVRELKGLERSLLAFVESCDTSGAGGPGPKCVILDDLAKPTAPERHRASCQFAIMIQNLAALSYRDTS
jgi:hypothetical protein